MTTTILQSLASDIADSLAADLRRLPNRSTPGSVGIGDQLIDELVNHVVEAMYVPGEPGTMIAGPVDPGHQDLERKGVDLDSIDDDDDDDDNDDDDEVHNGRTSFPNLKYAKPKYKNVESVLKYIEDSQDTGGFKLVIMNFND